MRRGSRFVWAAAIVVAFVSTGRGVASASGPTVTGAGSTWAAIALGQWQADGAKQGLSINYQSVGSTAGRQLYIENQIDFAASEIPFLSDEVQQLQGEHKSFQYLPDVAGGTAFMYNLEDTSGRRITQLRLSPSTVAGIFTGHITSWNDPAIRADNPGLALPNEQLRPVIRSDGSGTSAKLADFLAYEDPSAWKPFASRYHVPSPVQFWPNFPHSVAIRGSDGVANFVSSPSVGKGAIGYVEAGYAYEHGFTPVYLKNRSGMFAGPSSYNDSVALTHATLNPDFTQNLGGVYNAPEKNAYPLASYSYLITQTSGMDPSKGAVLGKWILYIACAGQREAAPLGYSPLPKNLIADVFDAVRRIPGAPTPPAINASSCPNPTVTGQGFGGGPGDNSVLPAGPLPGSRGGSAGGGSGGSTSSGPATPGSSGSTGGVETTRTQTTAGSAVGTGSPGASTAGLVGVAHLSAKQAQARYRAGLLMMRSVEPSTSAPFFLAAGILALAVAAPLVLRRRRPRSDQRARAGGTG